MHGMHMNNNLVDKFIMMETIMWIKTIKAVLVGDREEYITRFLQVALQSNLAPSCDARFDMKLFILSALVINTESEMVCGAIM